MNEWKFNQNIQNSALCQVLKVYTVTHKKSQNPKCKLNFLHIDSNQIINFLPVRNVIPM